MLFVLVVPNLSPYVASLIRPAPSIIEVNRQIDQIEDRDRDDLGRRLSREKSAAVLKANPVLANVDRMSEPEIKVEIARNADFARAYDLYRKENDAAWREANNIQEAKSKVIRDDLDLKEKAQTKLSVALSMASPLAAFTYYCADLTHSGARNQAHFGTISRAFWDSYREYSRPKMEEMRRANPTVDVSNTATDVHDMPRFVYKEEPLSGRIKGGLLPLAVLFAMALGIFVAAALSFNRTDAR